MTRLICNSCGFKFEPKRKLKSNKCPYCEEEAISQEQNAEELLNEVSGLLE